MKTKTEVFQFKMFKVNPKTKRVDITATCKTRPITKTALKKLIKSEMERYKYDFWDMV
jgi:hypothetical protein